MLWNAKEMSLFTLMTERDRHTRNNVSHALRGLSHLNNRKNNS